MSVSDLSDAVLAFIVSYGALAVGLIVLVAALGVPLPATIAVLASGAFIQQGVLDLYTTALVALAFVLLGDSLGYGIGHVLRGPIVSRYGQTTAWRSAETQFQRHGGLAIYLTRWLLTPIALPMNLAAGGSRYPFPRFLAFAAAGEATWLALYGSLGYAFGSQWEYVSALVNDLGGSLVGVLLLALGIFWLLRQGLRASRSDPASTSGHQSS